jgi:hypothetical protein
VFTAILTAILLILFVMVLGVVVLGALANVLTSHSQKVQRDRDIKNGVYG